MSWICEKCGQNMSNGAMKHEIKSNHMKIIVCDSCNKDSKVLEDIKSDEIVEVTETKYYKSVDINEKVGGWLLFYCISVTILSPLLSSISMIIGWNITLPYFASYPAVKAVFIISTCISISIIVFGIIAGIKLWKISKNAVSIVKFFLIYYFISSILTNIILSAFIPEGGFNLWNVIGALIYSTIWYLYFLQSKRVKNTYIDTI